jgi:Ser/Thr protein kinase RdoA (MazF antagonist)
MIYYLSLLLFFFFTPLKGESCSYSELLSRCQQEQVHALQEANAFFQWNEETRFQSLEGGLTRAKIYSFEIEGKKYVLRFLALIPSHSEEMRQNEIQALQIAHQLEIAPSCVFSDSHAVLMVMPFINGNPLHHPNTHQLVQLGNMLRSLHDYSGPYPTRYSLKDRIELHYRKGVNSGVAYPTGFDQDIQKVLGQPRSRPLVPSHGDLNPSNILVDSSCNHISIIDWTTATWEDPFADLSYFCLLANLSPSQEKIFLEAYLGRAPSEQEYQILKEEKAKVCLLTATLWLRYSETLEEGTLPLASRISALDAELHSPTLPSVQDYLSKGIVIDLNTAPKPAVRSYALSFYKAYLEGHSQMLIW